MRTFVNWSVRVAILVCALFMVSCADLAPGADSAPQERVSARQLPAQFPEIESEEIRIRVPEDPFAPPSAYVRVEIKAGQLLRRDQLQSYLDGLSVDLGVPADRIMVVDQDGVDQGRRLMRVEGVIVRNGQLLEHTLAEEFHLQKKVQEALDTVVPGKAEVEICLVADGWKKGVVPEILHTTRPPRWAGRGMYEAREPSRPFNFNLKPARRLPNITEVTVFLLTDQLTPEQVRAVNGFVTNAAGYKEGPTVTVHHDNRAWPLAPLGEPRQPGAMNLQLLVALLGLTGASGVIGVWGGVFKRRRR